MAWNLNCSMHQRKKRSANTSLLTVTTLTASSMPSPSTKRPYRRNRPRSGCNHPATAEMLRLLTAIELDRDLIAPLTAAATPLGKLDIIHRDVLTVDLSILAKPGNKKLRLVGNLPYNISSPILFHVLQQAAIIADMHFMLQKEVVDRMAALQVARSTVGSVSCYKLGVRSRQCSSYRLTPSNHHRK